MSEMLRKPFWLLLVFVLLAAGPLCSAQQADAQAKLFKRYDRGGSKNRIIEDTHALKIVVKPEQKSTVAVRVCSKDPLPFALVTANADPFFIAEWLVSAYAYSPERLVYLRSEDCLGKDSSAGVTELWTIPQGASLPPYIEKRSFTDAQRFALGKVPAFRGVRDYRQALAGLIEELKSNPAARGLVIGYRGSRNRPSRMLQRRLAEVTSVFARSGLAPDRYLVHLTYWNDETWESEPDPQYPAVFVIAGTPQTERQPVNCEHHIKILEAAHHAAGKEGLIILIARPGRGDNKPD